MKDIAKWSLMCASEMIEHRKSSWELYGFDYMIDDDYNPWLIEINSSPACDYSTKVTERYVQKALVTICFFKSDNYFFILILFFRLKFYRLCWSAKVAI
jgi:hypothetical protein